MNDWEEIAMKIGFCVIGLSLCIIAFSGACMIAHDIWTEILR